MENIRILSVIGTRPEAVKMAPLIRELAAREGVESLCCVTGQHRELLRGMLDAFSLRPDRDLDIMEKGQTLSQITARTLRGMDAVLEELRPDLVLVQGDTTAAFAGALSAFYHRVAVGHVEAGLRTGERYAPFPEEMDRRMVSALAELHFCPTEGNRQNLLREGIAGNIFVTGNTVIDALHTTVREDYVFQEERLRSLPFGEKRILLVTCHRRENWGKPMEDIFAALRQISAEHPDTEIVYPVHPNPAVRDTAERLLEDVPGISLLPPLGVTDMHNLMARSFLVLTDSGGLQEEAPALGKPVLVLRTVTERPEAVKSGTVRLAGVETEKIAALADELLNDDAAYERMARAVNPYGDGHASARIADAIMDWSRRRR